MHVVFLNTVFNLQTTSHHEEPWLYSLVREKTLITSLKDEEVS